MVENAEEIILDSTNNVFVGPDGYFKIAIDKFDGQTVQAWHIEDSKGNKTENLAPRAKGKNIDLMVGIKNKSASNFLDTTAYMSEQQAEIKALTAKVAEAGKAAQEATAKAEQSAKAPAPAAAGVPVAVPIVIAVIAIVVIGFLIKRK